MDYFLEWIFEGVAPVYNPETKIFRLLSCVVGPCLEVEFEGASLTLVRRCWQSAREIVLEIDNFIAIRNTKRYRTACVILLL